MSMLAFEQVLEADSADSGDNQSDVSDAEELSDESQGRGSARKRKAKDAVVAEEEDYDPLEDQLEAGNADSSASEAGDSGSNGSDFEMEEPRMAAKGKRQRRRPTGAADRRQRGNSRVGRPRPATPEPEQPGSEDDDFQLQQALAMSLLESRRGSVPASAQAGPSRASQAASADHSSELQQALAMSLQDRQAPAAREAAQAGASAAGQVGLSVVSEAPAGVKAEAPQGQPDTLVLQEEDIKPAEAVVKAEAEAMTATAAKVLPGSASLAITAAPSKAEVIQGKSAPSETATQPSSKRQPKAATGKQEARAQKSKKQPAKGKAIEIRDPDDVDKAFDMMAGNSTTIKEHLLQKVLLLLFAQTAKMMCIIPGLDGTFNFFASPMDGLAPFS